MKGRCCCCEPKSMAAALLRWTLGLLFLVSGVSKIPKLGGFVKGYLVPAFEKTFLPGWMVAVYGYALPFVEFGLGVLLLIGLFRNCTLLLAGATLITLAFGQMLLQQHATVANIFLYILMTAAALVLSDHDRWSRPCRTTEE